MDKINITTNDIIETQIMVDVIGLDKARERCHHLIVV